MLKRLLSTRNWLHDRVSWYGGALRSRRPRIRQRWVGERALATAERVAVVVHYSRRGAFLNYFRYLVEQLDHAGFAVIIVSNSPKLLVETVPSLLPHCALVLHRYNIGYDFGAWRDGILEIPDLTALQQLLITNDSVFGPLHDLGTVLAHCDATQGDVWGVTESFDTRYHLQSYFLTFSNAVLRDQKFQNFWLQMRYVENKRVVIFKYEIGLSQLLLKNGFRLRALYPYRELTGCVVSELMKDFETKKHPLIADYSKHILQTIDFGYPLNPTHHFWEALLLTFKCPFIKRDLLEKNPVGIPLLTSWRNAIASTSDYPIEYIEEYLQEASRNRVF
jgi:lipopolysaccharide biosynthesis protein